MNEVLKTILASRSVRTEGGIERPLHSHVDIAEGEFLQATIRKHRPRVTLEVGCAYGISSLYICEALRSVGGAKHIIIDPAQHLRHGEGLMAGWEGIGLANLERAGYADLVEFHEATSFDCLPVLLSGGCKIDFAFIDGQHCFDYVLVDLFYIDKILAVGGLVVFDDLHYPSIRKVVRYILTNLPYVPLDENDARNSTTSWIASLPLMRRLVKPELVTSDKSLGIRPGNFIALKKTSDDIVGDGPGATRRWDTHIPF